MNSREEHLAADRDIQLSENDNKTVDEFLELAGVKKLSEESTSEELIEAVQKFGSITSDQNEVWLNVAKDVLKKKLHSIGMTAPTGIVDAALKREKIENHGGQGKGVLFEEIEPWAESVDGPDLLQELVTVFNRFSILPDKADIGIALWVLHSWCIECFFISPFLNLTSPEKRCGKTTTLHIIHHLCPRPISMANASPSAIFRAIELWTPTLLIDEADTFLKQNPELNGILNSGHSKPSAVVIRTVGDDHTPVLFRVFCPKLISGIGKQKGTLEDRSINIAMKRKKVTEKVERMRLDRLDYELKPMRSKCLRWYKDNIGELKDADPIMPESLNDRAADNWRPLLSIADLAGGCWPKWGREAAKRLSGDSIGEDDSVGIQLLQDIQLFFEDEDEDRRVKSDELTKYLITKEDRPWPEYRHGKPITPTGLARILKRFDIRPKDLRIDGPKERGYQHDQFTDAFDRYIPDPEDQNSTASTDLKNKGLDESPGSTLGQCVLDEKPLNSNENSDVLDVLGGNILDGDNKDKNSQKDTVPPGEKEEIEL